MSTSRISKAVECAEQVLEMESGASIGNHEIGVVLEEILAADVGARIGPLPLLRKRLACGDAVLRRTIVGRIEAELRSVDAQFLLDLAQHPRVNIDASLLARLLAQTEEQPSQALRVRIAQRAFERVLSERIAPPLRLRLDGSIARAGLSDELPGSYTHAIIVAELIGALGEIFPLVLDAYAHDLSHYGCVNTNVIVVHHAWLLEGEAAPRAIYYNHATKTLWESDFEVPIEFQSCQFLCLGHGEKQLHAVLANKLKACVQVNPYPESECCDNKFHTAELLGRAGIRTPKVALLRAGHGLVEIAETLAQAGLAGVKRLVIQPNAGTEGVGVEGLTVDSDDDKSLMALKARVSSQSQCDGDQLLVRERIDCLKWTVENSANVTSVRINVCWDGVACHAESAYLQVAGNGQDVVSSVGRGGFIVTLSDGAFDGLHLSSEDVVLLKDVACAAVRAITVDWAPVLQVGLFGVDLLLERGAEGLSVWVLEINSRPAGLSYSELMATSEPGVSLALFEALASLGSPPSNLPAYPDSSTSFLGISE